MTTTTATRQDCLALPYTATSEAKAIQFASALEQVFLYDVATDVFEDGGRWGIAVIEGMHRIDDPIKDERITAIAILLGAFDFVESTGDDVVCLDDPGRSISYEDIPALNETLTARARRQFRIEDAIAGLSRKMDAVLAASGPEPVTA